MPKPQSPQKHSTAPSPGILRRLMGDAISDKDKADWPELEKQWASRQIEMPEESNKAVKIRPMGWLGRKMNPETYGSTKLGVISLNRDYIEKQKQNVGDVLAHELVHVGQGPKGFLQNLFGDGKKLEDTATDKEAMRKIHRKDIELRPDYFPKASVPKSINTMPKTKTTKPNVLTTSYGTK